MFILAGLVISLYPPGRVIVESANLGGWNVAIVVLGAIVFIRFLLAPYWIFKAESTQLVAAKETLSKISEERHFGFIDIAPRIRGENFHRTPEWTIERMDLRFYNFGDRTLSYKIKELFCEHNGIKIEAPLSENINKCINAGQEITYTINISKLSFKMFPVIIIIGFIVEYDNIPPIRKRGTKRILRYTFWSFRPVQRDIDIIEQDEYWVP